jgi:hypothetical protein
MVSGRADGGSYSGVGVEHVQLQVAQLVLTGAKMAIHPHGVEDNQTYEQHHHGDDQQYPASAPALRCRLSKRRRRWGRR